MSQNYGKTFNSDTFYQYFYVFHAMQPALLNYTKFELTVMLRERPGGGGGTVSDTDIHNVT